MPALSIAVLYYFDSSAAATPAGPAGGVFGSPVPSSTFGYASVSAFDAAAPTASATFGDGS